MIITLICPLDFYQRLYELETFLIILTRESLLASRNINMIISKLNEPQNLGQNKNCICLPSYHIVNAVFFKIVQCKQLMGYNNYED